MFTCSVFTNMSHEVFHCLCYMLEPSDAEGFQSKVVAEEVGQRGLCRRGRRNIKKLDELMMNVQEELTRTCEIDARPRRRPTQREPEIAGVKHSVFSV